MGEWEGVGGLAAEDGGVKQPFGLKEQCFSLSI